MSSSSTDQQGFADRWTGLDFALLTKHGKESVVAPVFREELQAGLRVVDSFDTDSLGTFTREVPRAGSQLDAARRKAELAIEWTGIPRGLGSEGSFLPGPFGIVCTNIEVLTLLDREADLEIKGVATAPGHQAAERFQDFPEFRAFAMHSLNAPRWIRRAGFLSRATCAPIGTRQE